MDHSSLEMHYGRGFQGWRRFGRCSLLSSFLRVAIHISILKIAGCSVAQLSLCGPMDCSPPGSSIHGILQARILEWVATYYSRASSQPKDWTHVFCIADRFFTTRTNWEAQKIAECLLIEKPEYITRFVKFNSFSSDKYLLTSCLINVTFTNEETETQNVNYSLYS